MRRVSQQIGWSQESKLYYQVLKQLERLTGIYGSTISTSTSSTTTTTTTGIPNNDVSVYLPPDNGFYDVAAGFSVNIAWWMKMYDDNGFPRIFSIGQYPTAYLSVSIEGNVFYIWYDSALLGYFLMPTYLNQWVYVYMNFDGYGGLDVYVNGTLMGSFSTIPVGAFPGDTLYIGSENVPNTYFHGQLRDFIWDASASLSVSPPASPQSPGGLVSLSVFNGTNLTSQLTDAGLLIKTVINNGVTYNSDSPYIGYPGSVQF